LYFLYPYFWGSSALGELKRNLKHPDPFRREFIRAGAARVVLPIRPGFELRFASFIATGGIVPPNDNAAVSSPYVSIAEEMRAFARTNYPGIVPANPDDRARARPLTEQKQVQAWSEIQQIVKAVERYAEKQKAAKEPGWKGAAAEPEFYPTEVEWNNATWSSSFLALNPGLPRTDPWGEAYQYRRDGSIAPFRIFTLGRDKSEGGEGDDSDVSTESQGNLIATWFEYTPTSGLDIQLNTPGTDLA
jgi:hypothetical protein